MPRAAQTEKVSVSFKKADLAILRLRAKRLYGGNLSALLGDFARLARYEEGADTLLGWLSTTYKPSPAALAAVDAEWACPAAPKNRKAAKKRAKAA